MNCHVRILHTRVLFNKFYTKHQITVAFHIRGNTKNRCMFLPLQISSPSPLQLSKPNPTIRIYLLATIFHHVSIFWQPIEAVIFLETVLTRTRSKAASQEVVQRLVPMLVEVVCDLPGSSPWGILGNPRCGLMLMLKVKSMLVSSEIQVGKPSDFVKGILLVTKDVMTSCYEKEWWKSLRISTNKLNFQSDKSSYDYI